MMIESIRHYIERERLLSYDCKHIVAVSGGADSVALLLVLCRLGFCVEVAHCNFRLRGDESDRDEQFVRNLCLELSVPFHVIHFDTVSYADIHQVSIEMAARELRYRYFEQLRQDIGASEVCVAHHQDDAVETLLMNLVRGTGIHGLTGIRPRNGHIVRPLLCVTRADILEFLDSVHQQYVTDSTNLVPNVVRNKLRLEVLPMLRSINPAVSSNIAKTAHRMAQAESLFNAAVSEAVSRLFVDNSLDISQLMQEPAPEYLLYELLSPRGFSPAQVEQIFGCLKSPSGRRFCSSTHEAVIDRGRLIVVPLAEPLPVLCIPEPGLYRYTPDFKLRVEIVNGNTVSRVPAVATLDADKVLFPLTVRPVKTGDRFHPFGMKGTRLVSDFLTDRKLSLIEKRRQLVVSDAHGAIVWLVGQRTDHRFSVDDSTKQVLCLTWQSAT